jgi:hypothetical protein
MEQLTKEQQQDIEERVEKAQICLKDLQLFPSAVVQKVNLGEDIFADKVICYLADTKFAPTKSPIQKDELDEKN